MSETFQYLFSPLRVGPRTLKNRIMSTGHMTTYVRDGLPTDQLVAYHAERAKGGTGLIIMEATAVHPSAVFTSHTLAAFADDCVPHFKRVADAVHPYGTTIFAQLFHPGREVFEATQGSLPGAAPSPVPADRFHVMPRELEREDIREIIDGYASAAKRLQIAGMDGVEIVASHGYLPAQFLNPQTNFRTDEYGGDFDSRLRFLREVIASVRGVVGREMVVGLRISGDELDDEGLTLDLVVEICAALDRDGGLDYFNVIAGSSATLGASVYIVPPSPLPPAELGPLSAAVREVVSVPVFVGSRINDPVSAERLLAEGQADVCGMTRALICDPHMPAKSEGGRLEDVRYCIGCNQACIGHMHLGLPISCIQNPITGREREWAQLAPAARRKRVMVIGGGPGGMKAAAVAASRGHQVTLYERDGELGGQIKLARKLPGRQEFGESITNLRREMELAGVKVVTGQDMNADAVRTRAPDAVVLAVGATPYRPPLQGINQPNVLDAWQVLNGEANLFGRVIVADWRCDWIGMGMAELLADQGCEVELCLNGHYAGAAIQQYVRDQWVGRLARKGIKISPLLKLNAVNGREVTFRHILAMTAVLISNVDSVVLSLGHIQRQDLYRELKGLVPELIRVGDCLAPRTAEEAILEGFQAGAKL